jgi:hypothetical protein
MSATSELSALSQKMDQSALLFLLARAVIPHDAFSDEKTLIHLFESLFPIILPFCFL